MEHVEDFLALAGDTLIGELLAGDHLVVDDQDRVAGIHRDELGRERLDLDLAEVPGYRWTAGGLRRAGHTGGVALLGVRLCQRSRRTQGQPEGNGLNESTKQNLATAILCDHRLASPKSIWSALSGTRSSPASDGRDSRVLPFLGQHQLGESGGSGTGSRAGVANHRIRSLLKIPGSQGRRDRSCGPTDPIGPDH